MHPRAIRGGSAVALAVLVVVGCADAPRLDSPRPEPDDKAGGRSGPIMITVADSRFPGKPSNLPLAEFARQVASRSGGSMTVTVLADASADAIPHAADGPIIEGVQGGEFEMAVVPARAWSDAGVTSLDALQAPFLVQSDEQVAAIVSDDAIAGELLAGLQGTGVKGLVLYPEGMRHLFGFRHPILTPADLAGQGIRTIRSSGTDAVIQALGGVPIEAEEDALVNGIADGTIRGADSAFSLVASFPELPIATGNLIPYAKVDTLVVNDAFWATLSDAQRTVVQDAAYATRAWAIENLPADADAAASYCETGGSVELADPDAVEQFAAATGPVVAELAKDPATDALMMKMRGAATGLSPAPVRACEAPIELTFRPDGGDLPDGIYRIEFTDEYLEGWGVPDVNQQHGIWTFRLDDGHWTLDQQSSDYPDHDVRLYQVKGHDLYWRWDDDPGQPIEHLTWSVAPNGDLTFAATPDSPPGWTFGLPLVRVDPLPG